ncbi:MAG: hypothetical protein U0Y10_02805 [Spirosomataceae bacterium]
MKTKFPKPILMGLLSASLLVVASACEDKQATQPLPEPVISQPSTSPVKVDTTNDGDPPSRPPKN